MGKMTVRRPRPFADAVRVASPKNQGRKRDPLAAGDAEWRRIQKSLHESNERFESLFKAVRVGLLLCGPSAEIRMCNQAALDLLGVGELVGRSAFDPEWQTVHEDGSPCEGKDRPVSRAIATRQLVHNAVVGVFRSRTQDHVWLLADAQPRLAADGSVTEVICSFSDITQQKRALGSVMAWKNRYDAAVRASGQILYDWDAATNDVVYGGDYQRILGYSEEDLSGGLARFMELVHPDDQKDVWAEIRRVLDTKEPYRQEYRIRTKDGRYLLVKDQGYFYTDDAGSLIRMVGFISDISDQRHAEGELRASEQRFRNSFAHSATGLLLVDLKGRFVEANRAYCEITGYPQEELESLTFLDITHPEDVDRCAQPFRQMLNGEIASYVIEKRYVRKDGGLVWARISSTLLRDSGNNPYHAVVVVEDITERKRAEEQLDTLSCRLLHVQDEERRRLARELHDSTAQSIAAMCMNLGVLSESANLLDQPARKALTECLEIGEQCIRELRTFSYLLHPPVLDDMGLSSALKWYVEGFVHRSRIEVGLDIAPDLGRLSRELELTLFRVVQESLTNIHRHSGSRSAMIRIVRHPNEVLLRVRDYGCGIPGASGNGNGTTPNAGVGIAGMRERARQVGGRLQIHSGPGGTDVEVRAPISPQTA
ncbi:MAG TPA: PAS domain S-box protein [Bryobacteraceae bacterium]|nr:PAS domain S-box protein [Bryobacteraceae bacterium]